MTQDSMSGRVGLMIAAATASVTLAVGVTAGTLLGYLQPLRPPAPSETAVAASTAADSAPRGQEPHQVPQVVLVPVQPEPPTPATTRPRRPSTRHATPQLASAGTRRVVDREDDDHEDHDED